MRHESGFSEGVGIVKFGLFVLLIAITATFQPVWIEFISCEARQALWLTLESGRKFQRLPLQARFRTS